MSLNNSRMFSESHTSSTSKRFMMEYKPDNWLSVSFQVSIQQFYLLQL